MHDASDAATGADSLVRTHTKVADRVASDTLAPPDRLRPSRVAVPSGSPANPATRGHREDRIDISKVERAIDLRRLRYFVQIVADRSFSTAAQRVHVAQPALSHHVRELEAILGVPLLTRSAHGAVPTEAGQCLYEHGITILGRVRDAAVQVSEFGVDSRRRVAVGLEPSVASALAAPLVESMRPYASEVRLAVEEGELGELLRKVETKELDIALLYDVTEKRSLTHEQLLAEALYLVGPGAAGGDDIAFEDLTRLPLILPRRASRIRERLEEQALAFDSPLNVVTEMDSVSSIKKLVQAGLGYSVLAVSQFAEEQRMGLLDKRLIVRPHLDQTLFLCHLSGGKLSASASRVRRVALQLIENMVSNDAWPGIASNRSVEPVVRRVALGR